ncbi:hypothetical protein AVEN_241841-1 [Araneus ventricosus]|uniref:Uncharacterized protein n=1 Tax=Araneus ventricosus TaxID=182803 RepID=A0A4Y2D2V5_ARAVE|nr:hypothetical protein AVEN_241841-1 [Araneus ventricosus]
MTFCHLEIASSSLTKNKVNDAGCYIMCVMKGYLNHTTEIFPVFDGFAHTVYRPQWPSGKVSIWGLRVPGSKPDSTEDLSCIGPAARQIVRRGPNVLPLV